MGGQCTCDNEIFLTQNTPVGHNKLGNVVSKMCKDADLQGQFTNHSLRATTATHGLEKGISVNFIMERMGHRDIRSLQRYQRPDVSTKIEISKALNCRSEGSIGEREAESSLKREVDQLVDDQVKRFCQDDNNATVKGSNSVPELLVCNIQRLKIFLE